MELSWSNEGTLKFGVHLKPNQQLKYLNAGSAHTPGCFKAITTGVCYRLTKLTTIDENSANMKLNEIYPEHFSALNKADLLKNFEVEPKQLNLRQHWKMKSDKQQNREGKETGKEHSISKWDLATTGRNQSTKQSAKSNQGSHLSRGYASLCLTTVSPTYANYSKVT
jgi:hypothetical protein